MQIIKGIGASRGIAIGKIYFFDNAPRRVECRVVQDVDAELARFETARRRAVERLGVFQEQALERVGPDESAIFGIHQMLLSDGDYIEAVGALIRTHRWSADYAAQEAGEQFEALFSEIEDPYLRARSADVSDVSGRVVRALTGEADCPLPDATNPSVIVARELLPSETIRIDVNSTLAIVTSGGSKNSHSAFFARSMGIPAVVGLGDQIADAREQELMVVDGFTGVVVLAPDAQTLAEYEYKLDQYHAWRRMLNRYKGTPNRTKDGSEVLLSASIRRPEEAQDVLCNDGDGVGLLRSEFIFRGRDILSEQAQFQIYRDVLAGMNGRRVAVRIFSPDAAKIARLASMPRDPNPALGCRGIRLSLRYPEAFSEHLRALLRASAYGRLAILMPMVSRLSEVVQTKQLIARCREELRAQGIPFSERVELGVIIETPAAALISEQLAREVQFFTIGMSDLTQYTLAADRQSLNVGELCDVRHPAVLKLIRMTAEAAANAGIRCGICGDAAADTSLTELFLGLGIRELTVPPSAILEVRRTLQEVDLPQAREHALAW